MSAYYSFKNFIKTAMADKKNTKVLVIGIAGALTDALKGSILELLKGQKDIFIVDGADIEKEKSDLKISIESLANEKAELLKDIVLLKAKVKSGDDYIASLTQELAQISEELTAASVAVENGYQTVKSKKLTYRVLGKKFVYKNEEYSVEDLIKDQKLIDELVELGVGFLVEQKEAK